MKKREQKSSISYGDFMKLDVRVCTVLEAKRVAETNRLLELYISTGIDERICVTAIGDIFRPEELINKKFHFVLNFVPAVVRGIMSEAKIMSTELVQEPWLLLHESDAIEGSIII